MPRHLISNRYVPVRWYEVLVGIFTGKCHEEQRKEVAQEKWQNTIL